MVHIDAAIKRNEILAFATTWMDLKVFILSEMSQKEKDILHGFICTWNLKTKRKKQ